MFKKAERKQAKLRLALCGPSGSGKTYSALLIAQGLAPGGRIALIDTERGSGELYADLIDYDVAPLTPPYSPERYIGLIHAAEKAGYDVIIVDSLSHAWTGEGGVLDMHDRATASSKSGNSYMAWRDVTPKHNKLLDAILASKLHVIATMRTKTAYELKDEDGKKKPVKIGLAPIQRDGVEYEFTLVLDLASDLHTATASKDRTSLFDGQHFTPTLETGKKLREWLETGIITAPIMAASVINLQEEIESYGLPENRVESWAIKKWGVGLEALSEAQKTTVVAMLPKFAELAIKGITDNANASSGSPVN